jgi:pyridoxine 5-phosphate synthase
LFDSEHLWVKTTFTMTKLSVNVNKIATLRNSRGKDRPNVVRVAQDILRFGAHGITVHPRPDGRHIRHADVMELSQMINSWNSQNPTVEFNIEGYPSEDFLQLVERTRPHQCTLVPDPPEALTSNAGWDIIKNESVLMTVIQRLRASGVRSSVFVDPINWNEQQTLALGRVHPDRIELYTESYAECFGRSHQSEVTAQYVRLSEMATRLKIGLNAGHDLDQKNLGDLVAAIPDLDEVSIGHALVTEALYSGLEKTVNSYLRILGWR